MNSPDTVRETPTIRYMEAAAQLSAEVIGQLPLGEVGWSLGQLDEPFSDEEWS